MQSYWNIKQDKLKFLCDRIKTCDEIESKLCSHYKFSFIADY